MNTPTADRRPGGGSGRWRPLSPNLHCGSCTSWSQWAWSREPAPQQSASCEPATAWPEAGDAPAFSALPATCSSTARLWPWAALFSKPKGCALGSQTRSMWLPGLVSWTKQNVEWLLCTFLHQRDKLSRSPFVLMPLLHSSHLFLTFWSPGNNFYSDYVF